MGRKPTSGSCANSASRTTTASSPERLIRYFFDADAAVFHLAAVAFQTDGACRGKFHRGFQYLAVAQAVSRAVCHGDFNFVPVARPVIPEIFVGASEGVIAA